MQEIEIWKSTFNTDKYEVSSLGRVRSWTHWGRNPRRLNEPRILHQYIKKTGYMLVRVIHGGNTQKTFNVHKLVLDVFIGERKKNYECDHINRNRSDNRLVNLRWVKHKENMANRGFFRTTKGHRSMPPEIKKALKTLIVACFCI